MNRKWALILMGLCLNACSGGFTQDPFVNESEAIRNGQIPDTQEKARPPLSDVVNVQMDRFYQVREGGDLTIRYQFQSLHPEVKILDYGFRNLDIALPGAEVDRAEKIILWTAKEDDSVVALVDRRQFVLEIFLEEAGISRVFETPVAVDVFRSSGVGPEIVSVNPTSSQPLTEGKKTVYTVIVKDPASGAPDDASPDLFIVAPKVNTVPSSGSGSDVAEISGFMSVSGPPEYNRWRKEYTFQVTFDLSSTEITKNELTGAFGFFAFSNLTGRRSMVQTETARVISSVTPPVATLNPTTPFVVGQKSHYQFQVFDPKAEGVVSAQFVTSCSDIGPDAVCACESTEPHLVSCSLQWTPQKEGSLPLVVFAENQVNGRIQTKRWTKDLIIEPGPTLDAPSADESDESKESTVPGEPSGLQGRAQNFTAPYLRDWEAELSRSKKYLGPGHKRERA